MKIFRLSLIFALVLALDASAQPAPPNSNNPAPIPGLAILAAAGAALGVKKVYDQRKNGEL